MASVTSFENHFGAFSMTRAAVFFNETEEEISEAFKNKLKLYLTPMLQLFKSNSEKNVSDDGTVYTGSCGYALYYCLHSIRKKEVNYESLNLALKFINLNKLKGRRISFLCGDAGPLAIATVISYNLGTKKPDSLADYRILAQRLLKLISLINDAPDELLYGKAGYLYSLLFVSKYVGEKEVIPTSHIEKVVGAILKSGKQNAALRKAESPLMWEWHNKVYLGAAHGMAGILYMLLQARDVISVEEMQSLIKPTIDWLLKQQFPSGNFPSSLNSSSGDRLVQWCHGAPGFVPLCLLAYEVFKDNIYLNIAVKSGEAVWNRGLCTKGYSLCHGVGGNAYAFIQLYQVTKDPVHAYRACCFMEWCALERPGTEERPPDRPNSLFEGLLGRIYLGEDIMHILQAKFPAFTL